MLFVLLIGVCCSFLTVNKANANVPSCAFPWIYGNGDEYDPCFLEAPTTTTTISTSTTSSCNSVDVDAMLITIAAPDAEVISTSNGDIPPCSTQWIHGYSQDGYDYPGQQIMQSKSAADCQHACQSSDDCFVWMYEIANSLCTLKVEAQIKGAAAIELPNGMTAPATTDEFYHYCNWGLAYQCNTQRYKCATCESDTYRCIWWSDLHYTGPKYCDIDLDICTMESVPTTTTASEDHSSSVVMSVSEDQSTTYDDKTQSKSDSHDELRQPRLRGGVPMPGDSRILRT